MTCVSDPILDPPHPSVKIPDWLSRGGCGCLLVAPPARLAYKGHLFVEMSTFTHGMQQQALDPAASHSHDLQHVRLCAPYMLLPPYLSLLVSGCCIETSLDSYSSPDPESGEPFAQPRLDH